MILRTQKAVHKVESGKVTTRIAEDIYQEALKAAIEGRCTITAVIDDALRSYFKLPPPAEDSGASQEPSTSQNEDSLRSPQRPAGAHTR